MKIVLHQVDIELYKQHISCASREETSERRLFLMLFMNIYTCSIGR